MKTPQFFAFIKERHAIQQKRVKGLPKPWTDDAILQSYRFCNVYRELDTVTQWIAENWRSPYQNDDEVTFAMCVARLVNCPETLAELDVKRCIIQDWDPNHFIKVLNSRKCRGLKIFSGAYIVSTNGRTMDKAEYLAKEVLTPLWESRGVITLWNIRVHGLAGLHTALCSHQGMGSFMAAQVVADVKYVPKLLQVDDWWTFAASGPGSRRGLNRVMNKPVDATWPGDTWNVGLQNLNSAVAPLVKKAGMPRLHMQDLQNCLCEFDKYERTRLNEGRPRSLYNGRG